MNAIDLLRDRNQTRTDTIRRKPAWRLTVAAVVVVAFSGSATAQEESDGLEEIVVTGSHIRKDTFTSSAPLAVIDAAAIEGVGATDVGMLLARQPSITSGIDGSSSNITTQNPQTTGIHTIALRNLGTARTLVLMNGRRYVSGTSAGAGYGVDLNSIPTTMIERIEVLTGGQSAAYGSDAIAGVVNIITKTDFEGAQLNAQVSQTSRSDRKQQNIDLTLGKNFDGGNVWFSAGYANDEGLLSPDRPFSSQFDFNLDTDGDGLIDSLSFLGSSFPPGARLFGGGVNVNGDGSPFNNSLDPNNTDRFEVNDFRTLLVPLERQFVATGLSWDVSEKTRVTVETNYARVDSTGLMEPVPLDTRNHIFRVTRGGSSGIDLATHPLWAGSSAGAQFVAAGITSLDDISPWVRTNEMGQLGAENTRTTFRFALAVDREYDNGMLLNVHGTYGATDQNQTNLGDINIERAALALDIEPDGFGGYQCVNAAARTLGCVPFNPFRTVDSIAGLAGVTGFSPEAVEYLRAPSGLSGTVEQTVVGAILTGDLSFSFGSADNVAFAAGIEYRVEEGSETPDGFRQNGIARGITIQSTQGDFDVFDVFGELNIPLSEKLILDVAARVGDYSTIGTAVNWKVGIDAPLSDTIRLRGSASTAVRAPNVSDLFAGAAANASAVVDPCANVTNATPGDTAENCRSIQPIQDRIDAIGAFTLSQVESLNTGSFLAGSPTVTEENATSFTAGLVFTPQALEGFSFAVDFYQIEIEDAIIIPAGTTVMNRCYAVSPASFDATCDGNAFRDPNTGPLLEVFATANNEDTIETSGIDLEIIYNTDLGRGNLHTSFAANFLTKVEVTGLAGDVDDLKGEVLFPEQRFSLNLRYSLDKFDLFSQIRYRAETVDDNANADRAAFVLSEEHNTMDSVLYVDLRGSYLINDKINVYVGANNLFDEQPPPMGLRHNNLQFGIGTNGTAFDVVGRQIYAGVNVTF